MNPFSNITASIETTENKEFDLSDNIELHNRHFTSLPDDHGLKYYVFVNEEMYTPKKELSLLDKVNQSKILKIIVPISTLLMIGMMLCYYKNLSKKKKKR
jgi:hypothetical protein